MDALLTLLCTAGCNFIMGVPGADDIMLNYQSTSFHDALVMRQMMGVRPAPEFEQWLFDMQIFQRDSNRLADTLAPSLKQSLLALTGAA